MKPLKTIATLLLAFSLSAGCSADRDWRTASRKSAGIAPDPAVTHEAVLQVYGAEAWGWRGWFAIHTWIAAKRSGASDYTIYDVVGWRGRRGQPVMAIRQDLPDRFWFGERPELIHDLRGAEVDELINKVDQAARAYPWKNTYRLFPGPNSNTFIAWLAEAVPELGVELPFSAIGSGYAARKPLRQIQAERSEPPQALID